MVPKGIVSSFFTVPVPQPFSLVGHPSSPDQSKFISPQQALRRIRDTLAWFEAERPDHLHCRACARDPKSHYMQVVAWDRGRRPTIYSCLSIPTCRTMEDTRAHMIATFQQAIACMAGGVEDWVWVLDMHGFGLRDIDPRIAFAFLKVSAAHYPERLAQAYIVSAPRIFSTFWHSISPFIDAKTKAKVGREEQDGGWQGGGGQPRGGRL